VTSRPALTSFASARELIVASKGGVRLIAFCACTGCTHNCLQPCREDGDAPRCAKIVSSNGSALTLALVYLQAVQHEGVRAGTSGFGYVAGLRRPASALAASRGARERPAAALQGRRGSASGANLLQRLQNKGDPDGGLRHPPRVKAHGGAL